MYGFDSEENKTSVAEVMSVRDISVTIPSIGAKDYYSNYLSASDYRIDGYTFLGIVGSKTVLPIIECYVNDYGELRYSVFNIADSSRSNLTVVMKALYVKD